MEVQNILYIGGFELPAGNAAAQRVLANAKAIRAAGQNVIFLGVDKKRRGDNPFTEQDFKCYYIRYPDTRVQWFKYLFSIKHIIKVVKAEKITKIICYNYQAPAFYQLLKFARKNNIKIYGDVTEWYEAKGNIIFTTIKNADANLRMKYIHPRLDGLIVISDYLQDYYSKRGQGNIINIPPLVDIRDKKWNASVASRSCTNIYKFIYAGSPGSGNKDKLDTVVECLKDINSNEGINILFDIVGITEEQYSVSFNKGIRLDHQYDFVKFHGRLSHEHAIVLLREAHFSIFFREDNLTNRAGFPTKFTESVTAGTLVITNPSSNIEKYFTEYPGIGFLIKNLLSDHLRRELEKAIVVTQNNNVSENTIVTNGIFDYGKYIETFKSFLHKAI